MNKYLLALILIFLKYFFTAIFGFSWQLFDPLLVLVVIFTYFHSFDMLDYIKYAVFCGLLSDIFSLDLFGLYILTYLACVFIIVVTSRLLYRHNWIFIFPVVFLSVFLSYPLAICAKAVIFKTSVGPYTALFFTRSFCESIAAVLWAYPVYFYSKRCACELIS